jgi:hypothetical protein
MIFKMKDFREKPKAGFEKQFLRCLKRMSINWS